MSKEVTPPEIREEIRRTLDLLKAQTNVMNRRKVSGSKSIYERLEMIRRQARVYRGES